MIPAGDPHSFGNYGNEEAQWIAEFRPSLRTCAFLESLFDLAARDQPTRWGCKKTGSPRQPEPRRVTLASPSHRIDTARPGGWAFVNT